VTPGALESSACLAADVTSSGPSLVAEIRSSPEEVTLTADRLGMLPVFYAESGGRLIAGKSLSAVVQRLSAPQFDDEAVSAYFTLGYYVGDRTPVEGVRVLRPGETVRMRGGVLQRTERWAPPAPFRGGYGDAVEEYRERFAAAMRKRLVHDAALPISGGRDSRHILGELLRQGARPARLITLATGGTTDPAVAGRIADRAGLPLQEIPESPSAVGRERCKVRSNHYLTDENAWFLDLLPHLEGPLLDGIGGDVLSNGLYFDAQATELLRRGDVETAAAGYCERFGTGYRAFLSRPYRRRWARPIGMPLIAEEMGRYQGAPDPVKAFLFWNRTRREIALLPLGMAAERVPVLLPYLDEGLLDFLLSLPAEEFGQPGFHDATIRSACPGLADIPYAEKLKRRNSARRKSGEVLSLLGVSRSPLINYGRLAIQGGEALFRSNAAGVLANFRRYYPLIALSKDLGVQ